MMRNKLSVLVACCILAISLSNCKKENGDDCPTLPVYQALTTSSKEWFPYTANRILVFENVSLVKDTLDLKNYFSGDDEVWNGDKCPSTRGEFLRGNIIDKKSGDTIKVQIGLGEQVVIQKKAAFLYYFDTQKQLAQASATRRFESTITLNNKTYTSVLVFECSADDKCLSSAITKFYFSKTKGLVAYERNGVLWTLR